MIAELINNKEFKADFLSLLMENRKKVTPNQALDAWDGAVRAMKNVESESQYRRVGVDTVSLKKVVLKSAESGLSLNPAEKECYIGFMDNGLGLEYRLGYAYRGLRRIMLSHPEVKRLSSSVVGANDKFEWRGSSEKPFISSDGRDSEIVSAFGWLEHKNGDVDSVLLTQSDLLAIEKRDIERAIQFYGDQNQSIYLSEWRKRMFEIEAIKALFRHCADILDLTDDFESDVFARAETVGRLD